MKQYFNNKQQHTSFSQTETRPEANARLAEGRADDAGAVEERLGG